jgi:hypothetical protein
MEDKENIAPGQPCISQKQFRPRKESASLRMLQTPKPQRRPHPDSTPEAPNALLNPAANVSNTRIADIHGTFQVFEDECPNFCISKLNLMDGSESLRDVVVSCAQSESVHEVSIAWANWKKGRKVPVKNGMVHFSKNRKGKLASRSQSVPRCFAPELKDCAFGPVVVSLQEHVQAPATQPQCVNAPPLILLLPVLLPVGLNATLIQSSPVLICLADFVDTESNGCA